jgi:hypothetical protein
MVRESQNTHVARLNQHVFTISDQTYKIMIVNGLTTSRGVEIVALNSNSTNNCYLELPEFPTAVAGTVGGLIDATIPMVCGGRDPPAKLCYLYQGQSRSWMTGNYYIGLIRQNLDFECKSWMHSRLQILGVVRKFSFG